MLLDTRDCSDGPSVRRLLPFPLIPEEIFERHRYGFEVRKGGSDSVSKHLTSIICGLMCVSAAPFCSSQSCCYHLESQSFTCTTSTCSKRITVYVPNFDGPDRIQYSCTSDDCCQQLFTTCTNDGACPPSFLQNPEVRARIDEIAKTSEVLVANCKGRYALHAPRSERTIDLHRALEPDRILR